MKDTLLFILYVLFFLQTANAQTTAIPDPAFEQKLIALGIDSDGLVNGQLLNSDAAVVTALEIDSSNISDLTGIAAFVNLDSLICYTNNLTNLDISANTALTFLSCGDNNLSSLDVSTNTALLYIYCAFNTLASLDVSTNLALKELYCSDNNLVNLNVSTNATLESLHCSVNNLTNLDVTGCTSLDDLGCIDNNLAVLDVTANTELVYLQCAGNNFTNLDASNNIKLRHLECANNNSLITLDISGCMILDYLGCYNTSLTHLDITNNFHLNYLHCYNANLRHIDLSNHQHLNVFQCAGNLPYLQICVSDVQQALNKAGWSKDASAVYTENCYLYSLAVEGKITIDDNLNCALDTLEKGLIGQLLKFERTTDTAVFYCSTNDSLGSYKAFLDTGTYIVTVIPNGPYWQVCPNSQQVTIDTNYTIQTLNWSLQELIACSWLEVDVAAPFLRMAGNGSAYTVSYCNTGTIAAQNAYVEVDLDADLNFVSSTIPVASQNGTIYTFSIGTIGVGQCGNFDLQVLVDTSAQFQQTHCTEVHIYPDSICDSTWVGPHVDGQVNCQNDSVFFRIENVGTTMQQQQPYTIFEDNIAMRTGNVQLGTGQSTTIAQAAAVGSTYRIEVHQVPGFPSTLGNLIFSRVIEGCNPLPDGSFNTGFVTQFSNGHSAPFLAIDCQQNRGSYDPNDKSAQPEGYGTAHYIERNVAIDYKIRFQNTGTDTAFNIVILDTLSAHLDIASLQMGASSHAYNWLIEDGNILKVSFPNVLLVDSNTNEPLSHGFFRYRISQKVNNPIGTVIENSAAIYFDFNPAILTNTTFHTIGENFVVATISVDKTYEEAIHVTAFPNPFTHSTTIKVAGKEYDELQLSVFDISGRNAVEKTTTFNNQVELKRGQLSAGVYIYQLIGDGRLLNTGKIIVQ